MQDGTLRKCMKVRAETEKKAQQIQQRTDYVSNEISRMRQKGARKRIMGMPHTEFEIKFVLF